MHGTNVGGGEHASC